MTERRWSKISEIKRDKHTSKIILESGISPAPGPDLNKLRRRRIESAERNVPSDINSELESPSELSDQGDTTNQE